MFNGYSAITQVLKLDSGLLFTSDYYHKFNGITQMHFLHTKWNHYTAITHQILICNNRVYHVKVRLRLVCERLCSVQYIPYGYNS